MNRPSKVLLVAITLASAAAPALAVEGPYGAVDIGQSRSHVCSGVAPVAATGCTDTSAVFRVGAGYQFVPMLGAELSYAYYGKQSLGAAGNVSLGDWKATGFELAGIGTFPLGQGFSLTGKVGIAPTTFELTGAGRSTTTTNLAWGVGGRYDFNRDVAVRVQFESLGTVGDTATGTTRITLITAGVIARF